MKLVRYVQDLFSAGRERAEHQPHRSRSSRQVFDETEQRNCDD